MHIHRNNQDLLVIFDHEWRLLAYVAIDH